MGRDMAKDRLEEADREYREIAEHPGIELPEDQMEFAFYPAPDSPADLFRKDDDGQTPDE